MTCTHCEHTPNWRLEPAVGGAPAWSCWKHLHTVAQGLVGDEPMSVTLVPVEE